jgi:O-antigen ligase
MNFLNNPTIALLAVTVVFLFYAALYIFLSRVVFKKRRKTRMYEDASLELDAKDCFAIALPNVLVSYLLITLQLSTFVYFISTFVFLISTFIFAVYMSNLRRLEEEVRVRLIFQ